ncbi:hypothetical protein CCACVL1_23048 [Corchorus capsularis]|uniref:Uncharacterized protein n=1 Tax=Corchorus capsularis TaxID=210143 RepID=A0A1R3GVJ4_COCAP|nr:hypothetical protein CCACVL1_23048 [Corchorus capsularis]
MADHLEIRSVAEEITIPPTLFMAVVEDAVDQLFSLVPTPTT